MERFYTPAWVTRQCMKIVLPRLVREGVLSLFPCRIIDPGTGKGAFLRGLKERYSGAHLTGVDLDRSVGPWDEAHVSHVGWDFMQPFPGPFTNHRTDEPFDLACGNPPFSEALRKSGEVYYGFLPRALELSSVVVFFLRLGFLASQKRAPFLRAHRPTDVFVLPRRPAMEGPDAAGGTDRYDYAFYSWLGRGRQWDGPTRLHWLPDVADEEK